VEQITKNDIIRLVSHRTGERPELTAKMVNETFTILRELMSTAESEIRISIRDFGSFIVKQTEGRKNMRNPRTNKTISVGPRRRTRFVPGKYLKDSFHHPFDE